MPGFLSQYDEVTTVYLDDDHQWWVKVRRYPTRGDYKAASAILVRPLMQVTGAGSEAEQKTTGEVDTEGYQNELAFRQVVDWNLTDRDDQPLPLAPDDAKRRSLDALPEPVFERIMQAIEGPRRREAAKADESFRGGGPGRAVPEEAAAAAAAAVPD